MARAIPGKGWFVEHFALMIELTRMLTNLTGPQTFALTALQGGFSFRIVQGPAARTHTRLS